MHVIPKLMPEPAASSSISCTPQLGVVTKRRSRPASCVSCRLFQFTDLVVSHVCSGTHVTASRIPPLYAWPYVKCVWILQLLYVGIPTEDLEMARRAGVRHRVLGPFPTEAATRRKPDLLLTNHGFTRSPSPF